MKKTLFLFAAIALIMGSCVEDEVQPNVSMEGWKPVYLQSEKVSEVVAEEARPIQKLGKIFYKENYIYVVERLNGIHVIDNTDPTAPQQVKFISIPGCRDIAMKQNYLYADNFTDLVVLDVADKENITLINRVEDLYTPLQQAYPEFASTGEMFECYESSKGTVVDWEWSTLVNPKCTR